MSKPYQVSHDLPLLIREFKTMSPSRLTRAIRYKTGRAITRSSVSMYLMRHPQLVESLKRELGISGPRFRVLSNEFFHKNVKHLRFELTKKEYSDFWYAVSLLGETEKTKAFIKMLALTIELEGKNKTA